MQNDVSAAQRSYRLRLNRMARAKEQLSEAETTLTQLFEATFKHPAIAREKFAAFVQKRGLRYSVEKMSSKPSDVVPQWKALCGDHQLLSGPTREREIARENLAKISPLYRQLEEARANHLLAERLLETAAEKIQQNQAELPAVESLAPRQKRRLRQQ